MLRRFGSHLREQWMGALALSLVLGGGTAYAVTRIDPDSVKSKHIVNGQVRGPDVAETTLDGTQIPGITPGDEVHISGQVQIDDPGSAGAIQATLVETSAFVVRGRCESGNPVATGTITIDLTTPKAEQYSVNSFDGGPGLDLTLTSGENNLLNVSPGNPNAAGTFSAMKEATSPDAALQGLMHGEAAGPNTCLFAVSAFGD